MWSPRLIPHRPTSADISKMTHYPLQLTPFCVTETHLYCLRSMDKQSGGQVSVHAYSFMLGLVVMLICSSLSLQLSGVCQESVGQSVSQ